MNKTKEQLEEVALKYASVDQNGHPSPEAYTDYQIGKLHGYLAGYEAAEPKWIPIYRKSKMPNSGIVMILFDNGDIRSYKDNNFPFAVATHYLVLPSPPKQ